MSNCSFIKFTDQTVGSVNELITDLDLVRICGWTIDNEESEFNHRCVAAPIYDYRGDIIVAISASGPTPAFTEDKIEPAAHYVMQQPLEISKRTGYVE